MNNQRFLVATSLLTIAACVDERPEGTSDAGPDKPPACVDGTTTATVAVETATVSNSTRYLTWTLDAIASPTSVLAHREEADRSLTVAWIDAAGATPITNIPEAGPYRFRAAVLESGCAVFMSDLTTLYRACPGEAVESSGLDRLDADRPLVPYEHGDGSLSVWTQSYASLTLVKRTAAGVWSEIEQYESSISYPTDVAARGGAPLMCFINAGDRAEIQVGGSSMYSSVESDTCQLAFDGDALHVLTDQGHARLDGASLIPGPFEVTPVPALAGMNTKEMFTVDGAAYVLATTSTDIVAVPLAAGAPQLSFGPIVSGATFTWDAKTRGLRIASAKLDTSGAGPTYPQTVELTTRCMP